MERKSKYIGQTLKGFYITEYIPAMNGSNPKLKGICPKCGNEIVRAKSGFLQNKSIIACPCSRKYGKHGMCGTRIYTIWQDMKKRCSDMNGEYAHLYALKGITVCEEWRNDFMAFYEWAMANGYRDDLSIDRIDGDKDYSPDNCRWATPKEQTVNRKETILVTINGETKCVRDWCKLYGRVYETAISRIRKGWNPIAAITTPPWEVPISE